jgi:hypothetical protein
MTHSKTLNLYFEIFPQGYHKIKILEKKISLLALLLLYTSIFLSFSFSVQAEVSSQTKELELKEQELLTHQLQATQSSGLIAISSALVHKLASAGTMMTLTKPMMALTAVSSAGAFGYFLGQALIQADQLYLKGQLVTTTGEVLEPAFKQVYKLQTHLEKEGFFLGIHIPSLEVENSVSNIHSGSLYSPDNSPPQNKELDSVETQKEPLILKDIVIPSIPYESPSSYPWGKPILKELPQEEKFFIEEINPLNPDLNSPQRKELNPKLEV